MIFMKRMIGRVTAGLLVATLILSAGVGKAGKVNAAASDGDASYGDASYYESKDVRIKDNITIAGVSVGGMTYSEAVDRINQLSEQYKSTSVTLKSSFGDASATLGDLGYFDNARDAVKEAVSCGNSGDILKRFKETMEAEGQGMDIPLASEVTESRLSEIIEGQLGSKIHVGNDYELSSNDDGTVSVKVLGSSSSVDVEETAAKIEETMKNNWHGEAFSTDIVINDGTGKKQQELDSVKNLLGEFTTNYWSAAGRMKNIERATSLLNGTVLFPGQGASVYDTISPITADNGYYDAPVYAGNKAIPGIGGGVCQVSTTLYNALLRAEVTITRRDNHGMTVHYVDLAMDAAISGHVQDLEFVNNFDTPIYIEGFCNGGYVTFKIYGKETRPANRKVEFVSKTIQVIQPPDGEEITKDPELPPGSRVVTHAARTGYVAELWKNVYVDGVLKESIKINTSQYVAVPTQVSVSPDWTEDNTEQDTTTESNTESNTEGNTTAPETPPEQQQPVEPQQPAETVPEDTTTIDPETGDVDQP